MRTIPAITGLVLATVACSKGNAEAARADLAPVVLASSHVDGNNYKVDTKVDDCAADSECTGMIRLEALGSYHINDAYPYKFTAYEAPAIEFHGKDAANKSVFGKNNGDFEKQGEKAAVVRIRFKAPKGKVSFSGKFKMSVCSEANCQLEQPDVSFDGTVR
jgi:hypothetical protein